MSYSNDVAEDAVVDHQGNLGLCVCFAATKAVKNGHDLRKFFDESINLDQGAIKSLLINEFGVR